MPVVNLSPVGGVAAQFFTNNGVPLSGGKIYTYAAGTSTPQATYTTNAGLIQHSNPIILDAAGRVPTGEIWLTDGSLYKFVLKDANDVLIATYDNLSGINSNFVNYVNQQEIQTATAGQTVFTLTTMQYQPGTGNLSVFVDGVNQYGPGAAYAYVETSSTVVTFVTGLHVGAEVKFTTTQLQNAFAEDASQVTYTYPGAGAVQQTVEARLAEYVSVADFGADTTGVTDATTAFTNAAATGKSVYIPKGTYKISSAVTFSQNVTGEGRDEGQTLISLTGSGKLIVGDWWGVWSNFTVTHDTDNAVMIENTGQSYWTFENFRIEAGTGKTGQIGVKFNVTSASIYSNNLDNFKIKCYYPIQIVGNNTDGFNANTIGKTTACYFQNFASAISVIDALFCDANTFSGYFETGTNVLNYSSSLSNQPFRQNRLNLVVDAVTRVLNTSGTYAITDKNLWTILDGGLTLSGKYPQNQEFIGPPKTEIRAVNTTAIPMNTATPTTLTFDSEQFDTLSEFANGAGSFEPKYAGYYLITAGFITDSVAWTVGSRFEIQIYKNGSAYATGDWNVIDANATVQLSSQVSSLVYMNGTTDVVVLKGLHNQGGTISTATDPLSNYINITRIG